jgi:hypothetical protein
MGPALTCPEHLLSRPPLTLVTFTLLPIKVNISLIHTNNTVTLQSKMDDLTSSEAMYNKHKKSVDENHLLLKINRKKKKKDK